MLRLLTLENPTDAGNDNQYNLTVEASDGTLVETQNLSVVVTDANETAPNQSPHSLDSGGTLVMAENEPVGTVVGVFLAQDPDGDSLSYHLVSGVGDGNNSMLS